MKTEGNELFRLLREYLTIYLPKQKNVSAHTSKSYRETLGLFTSFLAERKKCGLSKLSFSDITQDSVRDFLEWLSVERKCGPSTINQRLSAVRAFLKYSGSRDIALNDCYVSIRAVPFQKKGRSLAVDHFSEASLDAMLRQPDPSKKKQHRDLFFMVILYDTGARDSEMLGLCPADVVVKGTSPYVFIKGKGKKDRTVPIMEQTKQHFLSYARRFGLDISDSTTPLFNTEIHGIKGRMSDDNVARFIDKYAAMAREVCDEVPKNVTPHMWRHSRALHLYRKGVPLPLISEWLGHSDMETTLIYAYADTEMKRAAIEKATDINHPLCKKTPEPSNDADDDTIRFYCGLK
ncbi:MAG: site-specific integrase [Muribaculaceae bacterium]|nr:site-specific integrase [Muribaculaceae bacterium]